MSFVRTWPKWGSQPSVWVTNCFCLLLNLLWELIRKTKKLKSSNLYFLRLSHIFFLLTLQWFVQCSCLFKSWELSLPLIQTMCLLSFCAELLPWLSFILRKNKDLGPQLSPDLPFWSYLDSYLQAFFVCQALELFLSLKTPSSFFSTGHKN